MEQYRHFERHPHPCWRTPHGRPHNPHPHALLRRKLRLGQIESKSELPKMVLFGLDSPGGRIIIIVDGRRSFKEIMGFQRINGRLKRNFWGEKSPLEIFTTSGNILKRNRPSGILKEHIVASHCQTAFFVNVLLLTSLFKHTDIHTYVFVCISLCIYNVQISLFLFCFVHLI